MLPQQSPTVREFKTRMRMSETATLLQELRGHYPGIILNLKESFKCWIEMSGVLSNFGMVAIKDHWMK